MTWFFNVSHPIMTPDGPGRPSRLAHEELLENQQVEDDYATDLLLVCQRIHLLGQEAHDFGIIERGGPEEFSIIGRMVMDASSATQYNRQRRSQGVRISHTQ